ncbi:hypothetical protein, variant [Saprolegnia diclina VS20]|nr:hypothetical protein, variant [Saprolegnia diclina VS20]EQC41804.1 hypothetical protein, variant [Saprolegnia diclina VS20]|eukprot:XP_008604372.1 hypothetical protein, variant [Saprolegnia diclina VS20]
MWRKIEAGQRCHPPVSACADLAVVPCSLPGQLFVGHADAAATPAAQGISAIIALGTGNLSPLDDVLCIAIVDMEDAFLLPHLPACYAFLHARLAAGSNVLVHCAYGQSRSAAICVAFLMQLDNLRLPAAYAIVQAARPCIYINAGFLRQLELFDGMECSLTGHSVAHATYRTMCAHEHKRNTYAVVLSPLELAASGGAKCCCKKCNQLLCTTLNAVEHTHSSANAATLCDGLYVEPMPWMHLETQGEQGKITCPRCKTKLGVFH